MIKKIVFQLYTLFFAVSIAAADTTTPQFPDWLTMDGVKYELETGWGHPSPMQVYYQETGTPYPFSMISTANYRGHIAYWLVESGKLYLEKVEVREETFKPAKFDIYSKDPSQNKKDGSVVADWFTGVIVAGKGNRIFNEDEKSVTLYLHVKNGVVVAWEKITGKDRIMLGEIKSSDNLDEDIKAKIAMLKLNNAYISYHFRLHEDEKLERNGKTCLLAGSESGSVILEYFNNDHMQWPYNWENTEISGAPNGSWQVIDDKLYLKEVRLLSGLRFDGPEVKTLELATLFPDLEVTTNGVLAQWCRGVYLIKYGEEVRVGNDTYNYMEFKTKELEFVRIKAGTIVESRIIPADFDNDDLLASTDEVLKKLVEDYSDQ